MRYKDLITPIPITKNCVFAVSMDVDRETEHILIGERETVLRKLEGDVVLLEVDEVRPIGKFIEDCSQPHRLAMEDLRATLGARIQKKTPALEESKGNLERYYAQKDNLSLYFMALRIWQEFQVYYKKARSFRTGLIGQKAIDATEQAFLDYMEVFTLPLRRSLEEQVMLWQKQNPGDPLQNLGAEYREHNSIVRYAKDLSEYVLVDDSLMPAIIFYLKRMYSKGKYFTRCKVCGKFFLAYTAKIVLCSDACKAEQRRRNKQRFDSEKKEITYERSAKNAYAFWYNRVSRLDRQAYPVEKLAEVDARFKAFCAESKEKKKAVKAGELDARVFESWLLTQRNVIEYLLEEVNP